VNYRETIDWMFAQLPMYQRKGISAFKGKLDNIQEFSRQLHHPERQFKSIHVAGTNGKGSSCHMLASVLQEAGYKVGLYTSPHLKEFRERIRINGKKVSKSYVTSFIETNHHFLTNRNLSFFEMTVGMAFSYFAEEKVDIAIIEVGLGGRLDSTNIITPEICLITNIGYDHMQILGDTLEKIALEKAGIIKNGVPVVISERQVETAAIFKIIASQKRAEISFADNMGLESYKTDLLGDYQKQNILGVVACLKKLQGFKVSEKHIKNGLKRVVVNTGLLGRWQVLSKKPMVVCDTAHNKEGLTVILAQIKKQSYRNLHLVIGFVADKDLSDLLRPFPKEASYYFVGPKVPRGLKAEIVQEAAKPFGLLGEVYPSVRKGVKAAKEQSEAGDFIFIGGSTFTVAEIV